MRKLALLCVVALAACSNGFPIRFGTPRSVPAPNAGVNNPYLFQGNAADGRRTFIDMHCIDCHQVAEDPTLPVGRHSTNKLVNMKKYSDSDLANRIRSTKTGEDEPLDGKTHKDYAERLDARQLVDVVAYLRNAGKGQ